MGTENENGREALQEKRGKQSMVFTWEVDGLLGCV